MENGYRVQRSIEALDRPGLVEGLDIIGFLVGRKLS
jgi:hypothetical protein